MRRDTQPEQLLLPASPREPIPWATCPAIKPDTEPTDLPCCNRKAYPFPDHLPSPHRRSTVMEQLKSRCQPDGGKNTHGLKEAGDAGYIKVHAPGVVCRATNWNPQGAFVITALPEKIDTVKLTFS